ncbi:K(+)-transporting ATPase subunit C [Glaciihabitans arcticus]|uniref:Potassium-transporting ATPase KdpC subunit n=1 Tax=Glaciihabitans arcticus TaxID=2668039 RepID=A0A4Q9GPW8_9MICO|nr:K(+)-transporting ATPase subunit C [Glaciihabitans arcticus]TBN56866.1 K(+)-transporting ATPase subunit C [Glaciihabitans arcticus]
MKNFRQTSTALRALLVLTIVLGMGYPLAITVLGQLALPTQSNGSLVYRDGSPIGSSLLGQSFATAEGAAMPGFFQSRPSAAGDGYDGGASSGSNYGPENEDLIAAIEEREGSTPDALTASGSGLDPHISPENALSQVAAVAAARGLNESVVRELVESRIQGRDLGYLGEPRVNVLDLNVSLAELDSSASD